MSKYKTICKNLAFSLDGKCLMGDDCICEANKNRREEPESPSPSLPETEQGQELMKEEEVSALAQRLTYYIVDLRKAVLYAKRSKEICLSKELPMARVWEERERQLEGVCKQLRLILLKFKPTEDGK